MRAKFLVLGLICLFLCTSILPQEKKELTPTQIYFKKAQQTPLTFTVPKEKSEEVWGRIQSFIGKYGSMKIQVATDYVIETYNPTKVETNDPKWPGVNYGYSAIKTPIENKVEFHVNCTSGDPLEYHKMCAEWNAHILAYYALTGKLIEEVIHR